MTTQVCPVMGVSRMPNFAARSTTGRTSPRRLSTPRIQRGVVGTFVIVPQRMISFTCRMPMAYSSPSMKKLRYWDGFPSVARTSMGAVSFRDGFMAPPRR